MDSFQNMMKAACHIKSYQMAFDKKSFERLPEFYKTGLYCYDMLKNVRSQNEFHLKIAAYDVHRIKGHNMINNKNYDEAHYSFCKALSIFKYITNTNNNWKNEGVKDEDLEYFDLEGESLEQKIEIKKMKISSLLNIALCDLNLGKFDQVRFACDEVLLLDNQNVKALYRKAKSYLDCKSSLYDDYLLALKDIEMALKFTSDNQELKSIYTSLKFKLEKDKTEEKKVFKSFFRNVNYEIKNEEKIENSQNVYTQITDDDVNLGRPEIRVLNLVIEQSMLIINRLEREGNRLEMKKMQEIVEKAKVYKEDLQRLLELNFENPNEELKKFALQNKLDLNDPNVKSEFFKIRKNYLEQINKFYENNLLKVNPNEILADDKKKNIQNKNVKNITDNKNNIKSNVQKNSPISIQNNNKNRKLNLNYQIIGVFVLFISFIFYLIIN